MAVQNARGRQWRKSAIKDAAGKGLSKRHQGKQKGSKRASMQAMKHSRIQLFGWTGGQSNSTADLAGMG
jgi:hypothetical protein